MGRSAPVDIVRLRSGNRARYVASFGGTRSQALKFARRMYTTSITASFELPPALASAQTVFLRAQTKVRRAGARRDKLFDTFTLIRGIRTATVR